MKKIFLISGKSGSGKDTFAKFLKDQLETDKILTLHFGDPVKDFARSVYGWNGEKDEQGRKLLQSIGTDWVKTKFPTYWAEIIAKFIAATADQWDYVLVPDWRFEDEYATLCEYNGVENIVTIRIERFTTDGKPYYNPAMRINQLTHVSECALDNYNFEWIIGHSTENQLAESAAKFVKEYV